MDKYLGIDFGTKRIGLAVSDDEGSFAFPLQVVENGGSAHAEIKNIGDDREVSVYVLGDPGNEGDAAKTQKKVFEFKEKLESLGVKVELQTEMMTSMHTDLFGKKKPIARKWAGDRKEKKDESAAALILQRFLDVNQKRGNV
jgi:putative Holliday junction resolvase